MNYTIVTKAIDDLAPIRRMESQRSIIMACFFHDGYTLLNKVELLIRSRRATKPSRELAKARAGQASKRYAFGKEHFPPTIRQAVSTWTLCDERLVRDERTTDILQSPPFPLVLAAQCITGIQVVEPAAPRASIRSLKMPAKQSFRLFERVSEAKIDSKQVRKGQINGKDPEGLYKRIQSGGGATGAAIG